MRTKTIFLAALVGAASVASSFAQSVYSVNAVGFVNVEFPPGFSIRGNPLIATTSTVSALFSNVANGTTVFKFDSVNNQFIGSTFLFGNWNNPNLTLSPGEGFFFKNPSGSVTYTNTFSGTVASGSLTNALPAGFALVSSIVPQAGLVSTDLGLPVANGDTVFKFDSNANQYTGGSFLFGNWSGGGEPQIAVAEGFFVKKTASVNWVRNFSINQ